MTQRVTAAQVRRDARMRLIDLARGHRLFDDRIDPDRLRSDSMHILRRWALENALATGDRVEVDRVRDVVSRLVPIASGDTVELSDAVAEGGVAAVLGEDAPPAPTIGEIEASLAELLGGAA